MARAFGKVLVQDQFALDGIEMAIDADVFGGELPRVRQVILLGEGRQRERGY